MAQSQFTSTDRRRGAEPEQVHHSYATHLNSGQTRLQPLANMAVHPYLGPTPESATAVRQSQAPQRRDGLGPIITYDPHFAHLVDSATLPHAANDRRESSASVASSLGSYESGSTLTTASEMGDTAIMERLRKSFEQKEEFLRGGLQANSPVISASALSASSAENGKSNLIFY